MTKDGGKGGSPGTHTPGWDKDWPPKAPQKPKPQPKLVQHVNAHDKDAARRNS